MTVRLTCFFLAASILAAQADEQVRSVQEELRRRNIYFGDVDGRHSKESEEALKRYQKRKGLPASGREDNETLHSLGLLARSPSDPPPKELEWPEETVLKSDERVDVPHEVAELSESTGIDPESVLVGAKLVSSPRKAVPARKSRLAAGGTGGGTVSTGRAGSLGSRETLDYVKDYLHAVGKGDLRRELTFYADQVDYYGNGKVDRRIIEQSLRRYYLRWPHRSYSLASMIDYRLSSKRGEITVVYRVNFSLKNAHARVKGTTENTIVINAATSAPRIVAIRERRVRN